jgi:thiol-disulfide isomerase/thioredoxin/YHS domain-containing protein
MKSQVLLACSVAVVGAWTVSAMCGDTPARGWQADFAKAEAEARRLGVPLVVHFYADWCGPCRQMEADVLSRPELTAEFGTRAVGVKVNTDHSPDLVTRFGITSLPADVIVGPDAQVLAKTTGYQERQGYIGRVVGFGAQFVKAAKTMVAAVKPGGGQVAMQPLVVQPMPALSSVTQPATQPTVAESTATPETKPEVKAPTAVAQVPVDASKPDPIGLEGYSPVALTKNRAWTAGKPEFAWNHQGIEYRMATAEEFEVFKENPNRYAPQYLGCDPMILATTERTVVGNIKYGAFFRGALYLFYTEENRSHFLNEPQKYSELSLSIDAGAIELLSFNNE